MIPLRPDIQAKRVSRFEDHEIVRKLRVVRVLLPPVPLLLHEFLYVPDRSIRFLSAEEKKHKSYY